MKIRLKVGERIASTVLIPFEFEVVDYDELGVVLSLGGKSEVQIQFYDWELGLASIGTWHEQEYVVQSGGRNFVDTSVPDTEENHVFFRAAKLEQTREVIASFDEDEETLYDNRFGLRFKASSSDKILWTVSDPFAGLDLSVVTTRDDDIVHSTAEVVFHGNGKYYIVQGGGENENGEYLVRISEGVFAPEDLNQRCKACEEEVQG